MDNYFNYIEDYINGELKENDLKDFEAELQHDQNLWDETQKYKIIASRLHDLALRNQIKKHIVNSSKNTGKRKQRFILIGIVISLVMLLFFVRRSQIDNPPSSVPSQKDIKGYDSLPKTQQIFAEKEIRKNDQLIYSDSIRNSTTNQVVETRQLIIYKEEVVLLEEMDYNVMGESPRDKQIESKLNHAKVLLKEEKVAEARFLVMEVIQSGNDFYADEAEWLFSISWVKTNRDSAIFFLNEIVKNPNHEYRTDAYRVISKLKQ